LFARVMKCPVQRFQTVGVLMLVSIVLLKSGGCLS
jgi:hypothetical protein